MALKVYNYLTREVERFRPIQPEYVSLYACGPTVYNHAHLGHAKTYITLDLVVRYLRYRGYKVRYVRSLTDINYTPQTGKDRLVRSTRRERVEPLELAETYINSFNDDMETLGVTRPNIAPRDTAHILEMITWIQDLCDRGYAYESGGNVYFAVETFMEYGKLSRRQPQEWLSGPPLETQADKRHPADFILWQHAASEDPLHWPAPWGEGYPGPHIACPVIATRYLGSTFDIHGGNLEDIFPHHDCEIAQAEARYGTPYAHYWLLVGALTVNGVPMSQSMGNFLTIKDALSLYSPEAIRYFVFGTHYREPLDFSREALQAAQRSINRLHDAVHKLRRAMKNTTTVAGTAVLAQVGSLEDYREDFQAALDDDFNTPQALTILEDFVNEVNRHLEGTTQYAGGTLAAMERIARDLAGNVLGIVSENFKAQENEHRIEGLVNLLLKLRQEYREAHEWGKAEAIQQCLKELGILIEDGPDDTTWRLA